MMTSSLSGLSRSDYMLFSVAPVTVPLSWWYDTTSSIWFTHRLLYAHYPRPKAKGRGGAMMMLALSPPQAPEVHFFVETNNLKQN